MKTEQTDILLIISVLQSEKLHSKMKNKKKYLYCFTTMDMISNVKGEQSPNYYSYTGKFVIVRQEQDSTDRCADQVQWHNVDKQCQRN